MMRVFMAILCSLMAVCSVSAQISRQEETDGQAAIYRLPLRHGACRIPFPRLQPMSISYIRVMFFRMPALKILRASHRPLEKRQPEDSRLPVRSLMASVPCGHGTDRQKRTEDSHEYTHHRVRGLKFPMGTTVITPSSFTFRLLKSNSNS